MSAQHAPQLQTYVALAVVFKSVQGALQRTSALKKVQGGAALYGYPPPEAVGEFVFTRESHIRWYQLVLTLHTKTADAFERRLATPRTQLWEENSKYAACPAFCFICRPHA